MKKNFSDYLVALSVILSSVVLLPSLTIALSGYQLKKPSRTLQISYEDVTGIKVHSEVRYAGAPAGRVIAMRHLTAAERTGSQSTRDAVVVTVSLDDKIPPLPTDIVATLSADTLLAPKFVALSAGTPGGKTLANNATIVNPTKVAFVGDNSASSVSFMKPIREHVAKDLGLTIVADEVYTPPLADATTLVQKIRSGRPDFIVCQSTNVGDDKLLIDKFAERGITPSTVPLIGGGGHWCVPELMKVAGKEHLEGMIVGLANWPGRAVEDVEKRFIAKTGEPWFGHDSIFPYAHVWIFKEALERTGSVDRKKLGEMMHKIDLKDGPAKFFPDGRVKYEENGRRVGAELCIVQWQKGRPVAVHPESIAAAKAIWPKS
jgi:hypothetical protein